MTNRIRHYMKEEVEALLPILHDTYRAIGKYQKNRNQANEEKVHLLIAEVGNLLQLFKSAVQFKKQAYFDAILDRNLTLSDRIIAFDIAVGSLHIGISVPRMYSHQETVALRYVLEQSRLDEVDEVTVDVNKGDEKTLCKGIPASPGIALGKAVIITRDSDYRRLPAGSIVVSRMTKTEIVHGLDRISGIVTDIGGSLCHAAIIAREKGIPCVVATENATQVIKNRWFICVNGTDGIVTRV